MKIGDTTVNTDRNINDLVPNCKVLNQAAKERIKQYTNTAGINVNLLHTELALYKINGTLKAFRDYDVHRVLINSKVKRKSPKGSTGKEWFEVALETARQAIQAVKLNRNNLSGIIQNEEYIPIILRPEQEEAVNLTVKQFRF